MRKLLGLGGVLILSVAGLAVTGANVSPAGAVSSPRGESMGFAITLPSHADVDRAAAQGVKWIRVGYQWDWITSNPQVPNPNPASWNWTGFQDITTWAHADGLKVLAVALGTPYWANGRSWTADASNNGFYYPDAAHLSDWANYVDGMAARGADAIEVWNEPNEVAFVKGGGPNPSSQAALQRYTYDHVKPFFPSMPIISGGLAAGSSVGDFGNYCTQASAPNDPVQFHLSEYLAPPASYNNGKGFSGSFDGIGYHPYSTSPLGSAPPAYCYNGAGRAADVSNVSTFVGNSRPLWFTEFGVETDGPNGAGEAVAASRFDEYFQEFDNLRGSGISIAESFVYSLNDGPDPAVDFNDRFGVFDVNGVEEPAAAHVRSEAALTTRDATAPIILSPTALKAVDQPVEPTIENVTWTTDEASTSVVEYGLSAPPWGSEYDLSAASAGMTTSHAVTLTHLTPGTTYHYSVLSFDRWGNATRSVDKTFVTSKGLNKTGTAVGGLTSAKFSTTSGGLVLVLVGSNGTGASVTGAGLSWSSTPTVQASAFGGTTAIFSAQAAGPITNGQVAVTTSAPADMQMTVMFFRPDIFASNPVVGNGVGAQSGIGTTQSVAVGPVNAGSLVVGQGRDPSSTKVHTPASGQTKLFNDTQTASVCWVQSLVAASAGTVSLVDTTGTTADPWDYVGVEVRY